MSDLLIRRRNLLLRKQEEEMNIRAVCFKADGEQTVAITKVGSAPAITMQYSYDGVTWDAWDLTALPFGGSTKVYVRGVGNARFGSDANNYNRITFGTDAFVYLSGIIEALLDGENKVTTYNYVGSLRNLFYSQTALRSAKDLIFEATRCASGVTGTHIYMFYGCTNMLYAPKILPCTSFSGGYEYAGMFQYCTSLVTAPELPATTLSDRVYQLMFKDCTSLITAPELPATTLRKECYRAMFEGCTSLMTTPKLSATNLYYGCYGYMFKKCTSLVTTPELPATKLVQSCYFQMFYDCTNLKSIRCRAKVKAGDVTIDWLAGVAKTGTFYGHSEYGWASGTNGIPSGWEFVELTD